MTKTSVAIEVELSVGLTQPRCLRQSISSSHTEQAKHIQDQVRLKKYAILASFQGFPKSVGTAGHL